MRKEKTFNIEDRGQKLTFIIREMPATKIMDWTARALLLLAGAGLEVPQGTGPEEAVRYLASSGFSRMLSSLDYGKVKPLMEELLGCCYRVIGKAEEKVTTDTVDGYIEDFRTLFALEKEAFSLHFDFFRAGSPSSTREQESTGGRKRA